MMLYQYRDIVSEDGRINPRALMAVAAAKARFEREGYRKIGWERSWQEVLGEALKLIWDCVKVARACALARAKIVALPPQERLARQFDLKAELAETAIPPRRDDARKHRMYAHEVRAAVI